MYLTKPQINAFKRLGFHTEIKLTQNTFEKRRRILISPAAHTARRDLYAKLMQIEAGFRGE
jgi:hypothetical protein